MEVRDTFLIEEYNIELAKEVCNAISDNDIRSRALANVLAIKLAEKAINNNSLDTESGLYNVPSIVKKYEIFDMYINEIHIEVRLCFDEEDLLIPTKHLTNGIAPFAYLFVKVTNDLSEGSILGCVLSEKLEIPLNEEYLKINSADLISYEQLETFLSQNYIINTESEVQNIETLMFDYLDGRLNEEEEIALINILLKDGLLREKFINYAKTQAIIEQSFPSSSGIDSNNDIEELSENINTEVQLEDDLLNDSALEPLEISSISLEDDADSGVVLDYNDNSLESNLEILPDSIVTENSVNDINNDFEVNEPTYHEEVSTLYDNEHLDYSKNITASLGESINENLKDFGIVEENYQLEPPQENIEQIEYNDTISTNNEPNNIVEEQIDDLFQSTDLPNDEQELFKPPKKTINKCFLLVGILTIISAVGYYTYLKSSNSTKEVVQHAVKTQQLVDTSANTPSNTTEDFVMPNETIENIKTEPVENIAPSISIPEIEQHLGESINIANLSVSWEVPSCYSSSTIAQKYLIKIGKIIRLNLKTELLLVNKQPLSNKVKIELEFNKKTNKFDVKSVTMSSGEKSIDDLISKTIGNILSMDIKTNTKAFADLSGNPVLIIHL